MRNALDKNGAFTMREKLRNGSPELLILLFARLRLWWGTRRQRAMFHRMFGRNR
jgi:hypothetical protein